jgi:hypothetical protein
MDLHATEKYNTLPDADKNGIYSWKVEIELPNAGKDATLDIKNKIIANCAKRNE